MLKFTRPRGIRLALSTGALALAAVGGLATTASPASASATPINSLGGPIIYPVFGNERLYASAEPGCANIDVTGQNFYDPAPGEQYVTVYQVEYYYMNGQVFSYLKQVNFQEAPPAEDSSGTTYHFSTSISTGTGYASGEYVAESYDSSGAGLESNPVWC